MFCEECGTLMADDMLFCPKCGTRAEREEKKVSPEPVQEAVEVTPPEPVQEAVEVTPPEPVREAVEVTPPEPVQEAVAAVPQMPQGQGAVPPIPPVPPIGGQDLTRGKQPGKRSKLPLIIAGIAIIAILAGMLFLVVNLLLGGRGVSSNDTLLYLKDESLYETSVNKIEPMELDDDAYEEAGDGLGDMPTVRYSEDGRYLFYTHHYDGEGMTLSCIDRKEKDAEAVKVDVGTLYYSLTPDNRVLYLKNDALYINDLENKEKISSEVGNFQLSKDGKKVLWLTLEDGKMYVQDTDLKSEKEKLDSDVEGIRYVSDNLDRIVYRKSGSLYLLENLSDKEKIASDVDRVVSVVENGNEVQILYEVVEENEKNILDFVQDDLADKDAAMTEPQEEDYQTTKIVEGWWGPREQVETSDEYYQKMEEYYGKQDRDRLREELSNSVFSVPMSSLCLYDTSSDEITTILEGYMEVSPCYQDRIKVMEGYYEYDSKEKGINGKTLASCTYVSEEVLPKVKFSELFQNGNWFSLESKIEEEIRENSATYLILGGEAVEILDEDRRLDRLSVDQERNKLYAVTCEEEEEGFGNYEIGELVCSGDDIGTYNKLYEDAYRIIGCADGNIVYAKEQARDGSCDLYYNDNRVDSDVDAYTSYLCYDGNLLYGQDKTDEGMMTLKLYDGKETKKIADDVNACLYFDQNKVVVLADYSTKSMRGDLKIYNGKELEKVDTDVIAIVNTYK